VSLADFWAAYGTLVAFIGINSILALSIYLTLAAGLLSMGTAGFMSVGAYTATLLTMQAGAPFVVAVVAGAAAAALLAALVAATASEQASWTVAVAALATAGAGAVHFAVAAPHVREWWGFGAFFIASGWAQLLWSAMTPRNADRRLLRIGLAGNLAVVAVWIVSRTSGLPFGPDAGEAEAMGASDLVATALELVAAAACGAALVRSAPARTRLRLPLAAGAVAAVAYGIAAAGGHG